MNTDMNPTNAAPPTSPVLDPALLAEPAAWPKVIGIISTAWGALGVFCGGCGVLGLMMPIFMSGAMAKQYPDGMPPNVTNPSPLIFASMAIGMVISAYLSVAGIFLLMRKPISGILHIVYAVLSILSTIGGTFIQLQHQAGIDEWKAQNPNSQFTQMQPGDLTQMIFVGVFTLLALAWPLFCGIWFGFIKRDHSEISRGIESVI